ncbi:hypothetical protein [Flavobacterium flavipallidum]|uniref:DUF481 domain-containing protein n=1 Tax=Flavobacterium flavipallidum TaxID=3139140 RepID=A0ABU9HM39_9FLAO
MKTILLFIAILTLGCSPEYYVPNSQNIPIMESKGQTNLGIGYNESDYTQAFEIQAAHAITNHIALQFNTDWVNTKKSETSDEYDAKGNMLEIGAGYFSSISRHFVFETYGLVCFGSLKYESLSSSNAQNFSAKFNRIGIQPSISYNRKHFTGSISSRIVHLKYRDINGDPNSTDFDTNYLSTNNSYWLLEPAITLQAGTENVKFQLQYVYSQNLTDSSFPQEPDIISLGIKFKINPKKQMATMNK